MSSGGLHKVAHGTPVGISGVSCAGVSDKTDLTLLEHKEILFTYEVAAFSCSKTL